MNIGPSGIYPLAVVGSVLRKAFDSPAWAKAWGGVAAVTQVLYDDLFWSLLPIYLLSSVLDYWFGQRAAKAKDEYSHWRAEFGLQSKLAGLAIVALLWLVEDWAGRQGIVSTQGMIATGLMFFLVARDMDSLRAHREALGAPPWPMLDAVLDWMHRIPDKLLTSELDFRRRKGNHVNHPRRRWSDEPAGDEKTDETAADRGDE